MTVMIVGDISEELAKFAASVDPDAKLLTKDDYSTLGTLANGTYYISLGDFDQWRQYVEFLELANKIIYHPPSQWSDTDKKGFSYMKHWTELALYYFYDKAEIENFTVASAIDTTHALALADTRKTSDSQIWIAGDSVGHGVGVDRSKTFGQLIANHLNLQVSFLTAPRASIAWMADQILRSDVKAGDLVVLSVIPTARLPYYCNRQTIHLSVDNYKTNPEIDQTIPLSLLASDHVNVYQTMTSLHQTVNFCKKLGVHLIIIALVSSQEVLTECLQFPGYINLSYYRFGLDTHNMYLDFGTDSQHPGPITHEFYAEKIIAKINQSKINVPNSSTLTQ